MRALFTSTALSGHVHPLLPFAQALGAAGHEIGFAVASDFAPTVERYGFRHFAAGFTGDFTEVYPELAHIWGDARFEFVHRKVFGGLYPTHMLPDLLAIAAEWHPDLFVHEDRELAACVVAEKLGLPHAIVGVSAGGDMVPPEWLQEPFNSLRASCGLAPDPDMATRYRYLRLNPFPPRLADPRFPVPPTSHAIRPQPEDRSGSEDVPPWVHTLPTDRPAIYVGLGTVQNRPELFQTIIEGLRDEAITLIVTVGRNLDPATFGEQPGNVHIERYIPLSQLLARCDAAVINGGSGTLMAALVHGLPAVVMPIIADQFVNAHRFAALGMGIEIPPAALAPERVRLAIRSILGEPHYREHALQMRAEIEALPGMDYAASLLERLARDRQPIPAGA